jgi:hypothetical protein
MLFPHLTVTRPVFFVIEDGRFVAAGEVPEVHLGRSAGALPT